MNKIELNKGNVTNKRIAVQFCNKFFNGNETNGCLDFLSSFEKNKDKVCPYGYACAHGINTVFCGFLSHSYGDFELIKKRKQYYKVKDVETLTDEEHEQLSSVVYNIDYCFICSQTAHDLIHYSGHLKSLIDEVNNSFLQDKDIVPIIREYRKYISAIETYQKTSQAIRAKYDSLSDKPISRLYNYWRERRDNYDRLIDAISDISDRIKTYLKTIPSDKYENHYAELSLVSMQSLFEFRIKYHFVTLNELMDNNATLALKIYKFNWHKMSKKLANILSYQAKMKGISFVFDGKSFNYFFSRENVFLALYILLENSVKYCLTSVDCEIVLSFRDDDNGCSLEIRNASDFIEKATLEHITERGVSGENSNNMNSNGIGLFVAKKIFEDNGITMEYNYEKFYFSILITAKKGISHLPFAKKFASKRTFH